MKNIFGILFLLNLTSCSQNQPQNNMPMNVANGSSSFEIAITDNSNELSSDVRYVLTEKDLKILFAKTGEGEKDSLIFTTGVKPSEILKEMSDINIDNLKGYYENACIEDGSQLKVCISKDNRTKNVYLSNYYHNNIGPAIELINHLSPVKYKIIYDKDKLLKAQKECDEQMKITDSIQMR